MSEEADIAKRFPAMSLSDKEEEKPAKRLNNKRKNEEEEEFKGVYAASILRASDNDVRWLGRYKSPETAAMVHDIAAYRVFGPDYDAFNFPTHIAHIMNIITPNNNLKQEEHLQKLLEDRVEFIGVNMLGDGMYAAALSDTDAGILLSLGTYKSPETAAMVHDVAAYIIFGPNHHAFNFHRSIHLVMLMSQRPRKNKKNKKQHQTGF